jgi:hypothetical protein
MSNLVDAQTGGVHQTQQDVVSAGALFLGGRAPASWRLLRGDEERVDVDLDWMCSARVSFSFGRLTTRPTSKGKVAQAVAESEQRLQRRDFARTRGRGEMVESVHPALDVGDGRAAQRLAGKLRKSAA